MLYMYVLFAFDKMFVHVLYYHLRLRVCLWTHTFRTVASFPKIMGCTKYELIQEKMPTSAMHMYYLTPALEIETLEGCL